MRALELSESVISKPRAVTAARIASIALVALACGVDHRGFTDDEPPPFGAANGGAEVGAPPPSDGVNPPAGGEGVAGNPGGGGSSNVGSPGSSVTPVSGPPLPATAGAGGSANAGSAGNSAGGAGSGDVGPGDVGPGGGGSANASSAGNSAGGGMASAGEPGVAPAAGPCALRLVVNTPASFEDVMAVVASDVLAFAVADRPFLRYITLTNRQNAGAPACELDADERLLVEVLDSFVVDPTRRPASPVAAGSMNMYRIDLRAYGWNVGVALRGLQFLDTWEAMIQFSPYSAEFLGGDANTIVTATNTTVPIQLASALIEQVLAGVPPLPGGVLAGLQQDAALAAALSRIAAPVELPDVAGDFGITRNALSSAVALGELDSAFQALSGGGLLDRSVYAPLFLPSLCILTEDQPSRVVTCSR